MTRKEASIHRQYLSPSQESTLADWCTHLAAAAKPLSYDGVRTMATKIKGGKPPSRRWYEGFLRRHPELKARKPTGLDPKRANNFNKTVVEDYFEMRRWLNDQHDGIPPEQDWNMDEKGCQFGGGRTNNQTRYLFSVNAKERYRIHSDNLELATVIECVSAAGDSLPPSVILKDGPMPDLRGISQNCYGM